MPEREDLCRDVMAPHHVGVIFDHTICGEDQIFVGIHAVVAQGDNVRLKSCFLDLHDFAVDSPHQDIDLALGEVIYP